MTDNNPTAPAHARPTGRVVRYPIRGALWGLLLGLGAAIYSLLFGVFEISSIVGPVVVIAAGVVLGILWATLAPAKKPKAA